MDDLVVFVEVDHELGDVGEDVHRTEVVGHPPPLFHVGEQLLGERLAAIGEIGLAQLLELRLLGMDAAQVGVGRIRGRERGEHDLGIEELRLAVELGGQQDRWVDDASAAGKAHIFQDRERDRDLGVSDLGRGQIGHGCIGDVGKSKVAGIETPVARLHQLGDDGPALRRQAAGADPQRRVAGVVIVREDRALLDLLGGAFGRQSGKLVAQRSRDRI